MRALRIYAGPVARRSIENQGLQPGDICTVPGAAGGPKGLILGPLDSFIFGQWLPRSTQRMHLVGASIGAWRMATACLKDPVNAFERLEHDYIHQHYALQPGEKQPNAGMVSKLFRQNLRVFYGGREHEVLDHSRYALHIVTARGRHLLGREHRWRTPLGYLGAWMSNVVHRKAMGAWLERVVFSTPGAALPFGNSDYRTRQVSLSEANFREALQASCSIPFVMQAIHNIPGAPSGAYWDGGMIDYHLHLNYVATQSATETVASDTFVAGAGGPKGLVLYPHFQQSVVPGWLDKQLNWRHKPTSFLDNVVLLAPHPDWVKTLPNGKLPDRTDFTHYGQDLAGRVKAWATAAAASEQLADEFQSWLHRPDARQVHPL